MGCAPASRRTTKAGLREDLSASTRIAPPSLARRGRIRNNVRSSLCKTVVDVTNALDPNGRLELGYTTSGAEELQKKMPSANVVKAFNTVFAQHMDSGQVGGTQLTVLVASDHDGAKQTVMDLSRLVGFDAVDAGPLQNARLVEPLGYLNIQLGYMPDTGTEIGFKLLH